MAPGTSGGGRESSFRPASTDVLTCTSAGHGNARGCRSLTRRERTMGSATGCHGRGHSRHPPHPHRHPTSDGKSSSSFAPARGAQQRAPQALASGRRRVLSAQGREQVKTEGQDGTKRDRECGGSAQGRVVARSRRAWRTRRARAEGMSPCLAVMEGRFKARGRGAARLCRTPRLTGLLTGCILASRRRPLATGTVARHARPLAVQSR